MMQGGMIVPEKTPTSVTVQTTKKVKPGMPKRIRVGAFHFDIKVVDGLVATAGVLGTTGSDKQLILIDSDMGAEVEKATVLHEALHGFISQTQFSNKWDKEEEEAVVLTLDGFLYRMMRDNPKLVKWIMEG